MHSNCHGTAGTGSQEQAGQFLLQTLLGTDTLWGGLWNHSLFSSHILTDSALQGETVVQGSPGPWVRPFARSTFSTAPLGYDGVSVDVAALPKAYKTLWLFPALTPAPAMSQSQRVSYLGSFEYTLLGTLSAGFQWDLCAFTHQNLS